MGNVTWELLGIRAGILYIPARTSLLRVLLVGSYRRDILGIIFYFFQDLIFIGLDVDTVSVCFFLR